MNKKLIAYIINCIITFALICVEVCGCTTICRGDFFFTLMVALPIGIVILMLHLLINLIISNT